MDLEVARIPWTLLPFQFRILPPAASTLFFSSGLSGYVKKKNNNTCTNKFEQY